MSLNLFKQVFITEHKIINVMSQTEKIFDK